MLTLNFSPMKKVILPFLVAIVVMAVGYSVFRFTNSPEGQIVTAPLEQVRIAYKKSVPSFPIFVGIKQGYFAKYQLEVMPVVFESTNQMIEAVVRGDVDASAVGAAEPALAAEVQSPGHFKFYGQVQWTKDNFLDYVLVKNGSPITSIVGLKGKKVGVAPGGASVIYTQLFLRHFLNPQDVTIEQLDPKLLVQALAAGSVDAVVGNEPLGSIIVQKGVGKVLLERPYTDYVPILPELTGVGLLSTRFIEQHPVVAEKFIAAIQEAFEFGNTHPEDVKKLLPACCGMTTEIAALIPHLGVYSGPSAINRDVLSRFADFLYDQKLISTRLDTSSLVYP